jgi:hypothetical protein
VRPALGGVGLALSLQVLVAGNARFLFGSWVSDVCTRSISNPHIGPRATRTPLVRVGEPDDGGWREDASLEDLLHR